jgi:isopentenyl diphosphate isomerase/L-lactate dehydrogenase-like FMN-dependent dehydrogenase
MSKKESVNLDLWKRVKASGFTAMLLTTDTQLLGKREPDTRTGFELPPHLDMANFAKYTASHGEQNVLKATESISGLAAYVRDHKDNEISWDVIRSIKEKSGLKVIAKGIMCYEDAKLAIEHGVDGVYVSNHGAR